MLVELIFVFVFGFLLLALVFLLQKQRLTRPVQPPTPPVQSQSQPRPAQPPNRPKVNLHRKPKPPAAADGVPESAIKAVTVYTHDRATAERLLQSYRRTHGGQGWGEIVDQVIRDLIRDRR